MNKTLYCAISSHGFGHIAQSAPILKRLHALRPDINIVIQCAAPQAWLQQRFGFPFEYVQQASDFGMVMKNALEIDAASSHQRYVDMHGHWQDRVKETAQLISQYRPALVYSNIAYLVNTAAAGLSIPVINLCSLNWYQIYKAYCQELPGAHTVLEDMLQAYNTAQVFLAPEPSMPMPEIDNIKEIGAIARIGQNRAHEIRSEYRLEEDAWLVLVSHGGVALNIDFNRWPQTTGICYLVGQDSCIDRKDFIAYEALSMSYIDIMCSCDAIITKPGYGIFAEAACNGLPVLYTRRPDWPEDACLVKWLQQHTKCIELSADQLQQGDLPDLLRALAGQQGYPAVIPAGIEQAVGELVRFF